MVLAVRPICLTRAITIAVVVPSLLAHSFMLWPATTKASSASSSSGLGSSS
jgi:hypothetical protein